MKSFRHIAIFLGLAALLAGCVQAEIVDVPERPVSFSVGSYAPATKAVAVTEFTSSSCMAYLHAEGFETTTQDFFGANGETITKQAVSNNTEWVPGHVYYWPKSANSYVNFVAWHDANGTAPDAVSETALAWNGYTVAADDNLLWADEAWRFNDNVNPATYGSVSGVTAGVPMLFHHALAQVCFKGKIKSGCDTNDAGTLRWEVSLTNMSLTNVYNTGNLAMTNSDPGSSSASTTNAWTVTNGGWTPTGSATTLNILGSSETALNANTATDLLQMRSVLPQEVTNMVLSLTWTIRTYRGSETTPFCMESLSFSGNLATIAPTIAEWSMGHKITYTLEFDPTTDSIRFAPSLDDWDVASNSPVVVE
jgi:hypothetical protein